MADLAKTSFPEKRSYFKNIYYSQKNAIAWNEVLVQENTNKNRMNDIGVLDLETCVKTDLNKLKAEEKLKSIEEIQEKAESEILLIDDAELRSIIKMRYLEHMTCKDVAKKVYYDERTVYRKIKKALEKLSQNDIEMEYKNTIQ